MRAVKITAVSVLFVSLLVFIYHTPPAELSFIPACLLYEVAGLYCPFCGTTRALHNMLHGRFTAVFRINPLVIFVFPLLLFFVAKQGGKIFAWLPSTLLAVLLLYGILRNIPFRPFLFLRPF